MSVSTSDAISLLDDTDLESLSEGISNLPSLTVTTDDQLPTLGLSPIYVYYRLYSRVTAIPSKHRIFADDQNIGRVNAIQVPPPHTVESIKRCIASQEGIVSHGPIALFSALSSQLPLCDRDHVPIVTGSGPGSTPQEPIALVVSYAEGVPILAGSGQVSTPQEPMALVMADANNSIKNGTYLIRNPAKRCAWSAYDNPIQTIYLNDGQVDDMRSHKYHQWIITHNRDGGILLESRSAPFSWAAAGLKGSTTPTPWRFIPNSPGDELYYLTTDMNSTSPQVVTVSRYGVGDWSQLQIGNPSQLWRLIRV